MDPSWTDIKTILRRHEDMAEGSRLSYIQVDSKVHQVDTKVNGQEQKIVELLQRVEDLEQERHERGDLKQVVRTLLESLELECHQLRADVLLINRVFGTRMPPVKSGCFALSIKHRF
jgi:hypothetical protein